MTLTAIFLQFFFAYTVTITDHFGPNYVQQYIKENGLGANFFHSWILNFEIGNMFIGLILFCTSGYIQIWSISIVSPNTLYITNVTWTDKQPYILWNVFGRICRQQYKQFQLHLTAVFQPYYFTHSNFAFSNFLNFFFHVSDTRKIKIIKKLCRYIFFPGYIFFQILFKILISSKWNNHKF